VRVEWNESSLGELVTILDSQRRPITKCDRVPGRVPYYGATGVQDYVADFLFDEPLILVGEDGAKWGSGEATAFSISGRSWVNNHAHVLRPQRDRILDQWLVYYLLHADLTPFVTGLTVPKLNQEMLRRIPVPLPPIADQRRIVPVLDMVFQDAMTATANVEKNLAYSRELYDQSLKSVFGVERPTWRASTLGSVLAVLRNGVNCVQSKRRGPCRITRIETISTGDISDERVGYSDLNERDKARSRLIKGDILFSHINSAPHIGKSAILRDEIELYHGINLLLMRPGSAVLPEFLQAKLNALHSAGYWKTVCKQSVNQASVNQQDIARVPFAYPDCVSVQKDVVAKLNDMRSSVVELRKVYERKLAALAELKQSLLARAFAGELTSSDALAA